MLATRPRVWPVAIDDISALLAHPGLDPRPTSRPGAASLLDPTCMVAWNHSRVRNRPKFRQECGTETLMKSWLEDHVTLNAHDRRLRLTSVTYSSRLPTVLSERIHAVT